MFTLLRQNISAVVSVTEAELGLLDTYFLRRILKKKEMLQTENQVCRFIAFLETGAVRHFHTKNGDEKTCDLSFAGSWVTDFQSFNTAQPGIMNLQALETTSVLLIDKPALLALYQACPRYETFGRMVAEQVAQRATEIAMSLSSEKPEERFVNLLRKQPDLLQKVPQKYVANFLGISPESLSRIRNRLVKKEKS
ncbi:MAG: Crp/Fnr family transcriptional regulator [Bacteroidia bacterium]|jgi:CRP-like cAMP-binding protein|nr:Crp/Fnr family transcriptional regulator [Bacteroidia bacterium]